MFEEKRLVFYYCTTPVHMGSGTALGAVDNPIQREVHSNHPLLNGSGIKGAIRHHLTHLWGNTSDSSIKWLFGSDSKASALHAGALSFTDAQLVAFPVRSLTNTFVYVTCRYALARLERMAKSAGENITWNIPVVTEGKAILANGSLCSGEKLTLEAFEFEKSHAELKPIADWLKNKVFPNGTDLAFFKEKLGSDLVLLHDNEFSYFVRHATVVEPHVRIDDDTGAAAEGALFYTENLPPETILAGLTLSSIERRPDDKNVSERRTANDALKLFFNGSNGNTDQGGKLAGINGTLVQMGGDATTGRGLICINCSNRKE